VFFFIFLFFLERELVGSGSGVCGQSFTPRTPKENTVIFNVGRDFMIKIVRDHMGKTVPAKTVKEQRFTS